MAVTFLDASTVHRTPAVISIKGDNAISRAISRFVKTGPISETGGSSPVTGAVELSRLGKVGFYLEAVRS
jgi:hypothetical protein